MQTILLVEDDTIIAQTIAAYLKQWGYLANTARDFQHVDQSVTEVNPDLVLMDINLPFYNGFHWLEQIRKTSRVPVIFLTSAGSDMNLVMAMNMGADDFIAKPVELPVLLAKIQGLLRRAYTYQNETGTYTVGQFTLEALDNRVRTGEHLVDLSPNETRILRLLFQAQGQTVSRQTIIEHLWASDEFIDKNTLAVTITRLRKKVAVIKLDQALQTVPNVGFRLIEVANA